MKINEKIRLLRERNNLTQEEMANKLQLSTNGYANIERGESRVNFERLEEIANIFGIDVTELVSFGEQNHINFSHSTTHTNNSLNIIGRISNDIWEIEIARLQLTIANKDDIIMAREEAIQQKNKLIQAKNDLLEQQKREIDTLKLLIDTLKKQKENDNYH